MKGRWILGLGWLYDALCIFVWMFHIIVKMADLPAALNTYAFGLRCNQARN